MLHTITMFAEETKLGREDNLFLNTKGLIRVLTQDYLSLFRKLGKTWEIFLSRCKKSTTQEF